MGFLQFLFLILENFLKLLTCVFFFKRPEVLWNCPLDSIAVRIGSYWTISVFEEIPSERYKLIWVYETDRFVPFSLFKVFNSILYFEDGGRPRSIWFPLRAISRYRRDIAFVDNEVVCAVAKYSDGSFYIDVNTSEFENLLKIPNIFYRKLNEKRFLLTYWCIVYPENKHLLPGDYYKFDCIFNFYDSMFTQYRCRLRENFMVTEYKYACFVDEQFPFIKNCFGKYAGIIAAGSAILVITFPFLAWEYSII